MQFSEKPLASPSPKEVRHTFYVAAGHGHTAGSPNPVLWAKLKDQLQTAGANSTLLWLGDNIGPEKDAWEADRKLIQQQLQVAEGFKGSVTFLPGNNEWKSKDVERIQRVEEYLDDVEGQEDYVLPKNACPLDYKAIGDDLALILIDSKWFISNWSRVKGINRKCTNVVTRMRFAEELEGLINDAQGRNIVIAMHHPIFSNGPYAGEHSFASQLKPAPVLGTLMDGIADLAAFSPDKLLARRYNYLRVLVSSLAKDSDRVTLVSAHEESLQYLKGGQLHQIVSGSLGSATSTKRTKGSIKTLGGELSYAGQFTWGRQGFAKLTFFHDGSSEVAFITADHAPKIMPVLEPFESPTPPDYTTITDSVVSRSLYREGDGKERSGFYTWLWGQRYRRYYKKEVSAPVGYLDSLHGGLHFGKKGGGHQSYSIRLLDGEDRQFAMRSLKKDPLKYLKFSVRGVAYAEEDYAGTVPETLIKDFFTSAHPYMQLVINPLAQPVDVNHARTELYFVPMQEPLRGWNREFGNKLYYIEPRPSDEQYNYKGYRRTLDDQGKITDFESTTDMLEKIKSDESYFVDQQSYIRARVFDMLIGDWDRHQDQWRWAEYEKPNGDKEFMPVPRDRDNAFPRFDGTAVEVIKWFVPITRQWQSYGPTIRNTKWLNYNGSRLDRTLLPQCSADQWEKEAHHIQANLTEAAIDSAFLRLPQAVRDSTSQFIRNSLKQRLKKLHVYAREYGAYLDETVVVHATEKDDAILIERRPNGETRVEIRRLLSDEKNELFYERTFYEESTEEIWVYGLGDNDNFLVTGKGDAKTFVRLIGGYGKDDYDIENTKRIKIYDWKQEESEFEQKGLPKQLTDVYPTNTFHWRYFKPDRNILVPNAGFRTDDGVFLGIKNTYKNNGFNGNPFRQKHTLWANYYLGFQASELGYEGIFANLIPKWNFEVDGYWSSDRYVQNFFGLGNESQNSEDALGRDFYRARTQKVRVGAGVAYHTLRIKGIFESYGIQEMEDRFFTPANVSEAVFDRQYYVGSETSAYYYNDDADDFPTKGLYFGLTAGYKMNPAIADNRFGYFSFKTSVVHKLNAEGSIALSTEAEYKTNFGGDYFFYHAPALGGNNGLRGFRDERFTGKSYFYQSTDVRFLLKRYLTPLAPLTVGAFLGYDYGRVWEPNERSNTWHTSQGVGVWASIGNYLAFNLGYFNSVESNLVQVGFGFGF